MSDGNVSVPVGAACLPVGAAPAAIGATAPCRELQLMGGVVQVARRWQALFESRLKDPVGWGQCCTLYNLAQFPAGLTQTELAAVVGIETPSLTRQLDGLQQLGLVERSPVAGDRRANLVTATPAAQPLLDQLMGLAGEMLVGVLEDVEPHELDASIQVMETVRARLSQRRLQP